MLGEAGCCDPEASAEGSWRERADQERALAEMRRAMSAPIYFEFDRSDLTDSGRATLEAQAKILSANTPVHIQMERNADDLGSDEHNLALGQHRAATAKRYLTDRNMDPTRVAVTSFGEERPTCREETPDCRALNRRDDVRITSGESAMMQR
jgi:peptidoglycan-associated lipoprotein